MHHYTPHLMPTKIASKKPDTLSTHKKKAKKPRNIISSDILWSSGRR